MSHRLDDLRSQAERFGYKVMVLAVSAQTTPTLVKLTSPSGELAAWRIGPAFTLNDMLDQIERQMIAHVGAIAQHVPVH